MNLVCPCGHTIVDAAEAAPGKAWLIADQDAFTALDHGERRSSCEPQYPPPRARPVLASPDCGRLTFADPVSGDTLWFRPESASSHSPLGSIRGDAFPVALIGGWKGWLSPPSGDLHWGTSGDRPGGFESFSDWDALQRRYFEVLGRLRAEGRLKRAWLHRGEETIHAWPPDKG